MNYVPYFNLFGVEAKEIPCLTASGAPTTSTAGAVGMLYMDTDTGNLYKCTAVADGVYTWEDLIPAGTSSGGDSSGDTSTTTHGIIWDLVNVTSSSAVTSVSDGASLVAVLTAADGYTLGDVTVTMGGEALTGVWSADTATVTIASVTGDVIISCAGVTNETETTVLTAYTKGTPVISDGVWDTPSTAGTKFILSPEIPSGYTEIEFGEFLIDGTAAQFKYTLYSFKDGVVARCTTGDGVASYYPDDYTDYTSSPTWRNITTPYTLSVPEGYDYHILAVAYGNGTTQANVAAWIEGGYIVAKKTVETASEADASLSFDDDEAQNYAIATTSLLGDEMDEDPETAYGIDSEFAAVIDAAKKEWMIEYGGDYRKIPIILTTDQHNNTSSGLFNLLGATVNWHDVSKVVNLGDTCANWDDGDTEHPLLTEPNLDAWMRSIKPVPFSKRLDVFGNHDVWVREYNEDGTFTVSYPSSQAHLYQYFRNIYARRTNNNGWFVVYDDAFNVKYVVVSAFEYNGTDSKKRIRTAQMAWLIEELEKNDGYDVVIASHIPLLQNPNRNAYPDGEVYEAAYRVASINTDALFSARKNRAAGTITDSDGVSHEYDFTGCINPVLCSLHGHTHYDAYMYLEDSLLVYAFDKFYYDTTFYFALIDRVNSQLNIWKVSNPSSGPTVLNYQVPFDRVAVTSMALDATTTSIAVGETFQLTGTIEPDEATIKRIVWSSANEEVATVESGLITAVSAGEVVITAMSADNNELTATCTVTVTE